MRITPAASSASIVLVGHFNPVILSPQWLARHEAISDSEADGSEVKVIHPEISAFALSWCAFNVVRERFHAETAEAPLVRLSDLVAKIFGELLPSTPIRALGINFSLHFAAPSASARVMLGRTLSPPENWGSWGRGILNEITSFDGTKRHGGVLSVTMQQLQLSDRDEGWLNVKVEPSAKLPPDIGVFVEVNDHYVIPSSDGLSEAAAYAQLLDSRFDDSIARSEGIVDQLMELCT